MDKFPDVLQILTITFPPLERIAKPEDAAELARIANDEMAELIVRHSDRFVVAIANLPMNDMESTLRETDRVIRELRFRGVQIYSDVNGEPLDLLKFMPLYEKMASYNLPILIHPFKEETMPDYPNEKKSKYGIAPVFGYPYETSVAMARLVYGGVLERFPNLKFITHHAGGMVPYFAQRIKKFFDSREMRPRNWDTGLTRHPMEYFHMFYADTAIEGHSAGLMCAYNFFGPEHLLFGTDVPYDPQHGERLYREVIRSVEEMDISNIDRKKIFEDNIKNIMRLPV
jgi:predicted TIM-barrel fold metal-dependent hydrolase